MKNEKVVPAKAAKSTKTATFYKSALDGMKWLKDSTTLSFNYLAGINRPINPGQVTKLAQSLEAMGVVRPVVITEVDFINGKKAKYIIDGQHLFNALLRLGWNIPYVTINVNSKQELVETIAKLNSSSKSWSMQDYVTAWSSLNNDFVKLNHYYQIYDMEISQIASILSGNNAATGGVINRKIKDGSFKIVNEALNADILDHVTDMLKIVPRMNRWENKYAISEYVKFLRSAKKYNHKAFIEKLQKNKQKFMLATQEEGKLAELFDQLA